MTQEVTGRLHANWDSYWKGFMTNPAIEWVRFNLIKGACDRLLKKFKKSDGMRFCELGAGTGVVSRYLGDTYQAHITLVDSNSKAFEFIAKTFEGFSAKYEMVRRDVFDLSAYAGQFDLVHSGGLIEHFVDEAREGIIKAHCALVKKDGYIMILVPSPNVWYKILNEGIFKALHLLDEIQEVPWPLDELKESLRRHGFEVIQTTTVLTEIGVLAKRK